jgi:hypothetical protein
VGISCCVVSKDYAQKIEDKVQGFKTQTAKELSATFISVNGVKLNMYARELVMAEVILDDLFI